MRAHEIILPYFYIRTSSEQALGSIIERTNSVFPLGALLEGRLEYRRPHDRLLREKSLYLIAENPPSGMFVYEVEALGTVDYLHTGWLHLLAAIPSDQASAIDQYATAYWSGLQSPESRDEPWEYRAMRVRIKRRCFARKG